jgi:hypothetical protein
MYDYGNARVAALRSRLLDPAAVRRLADADSTSAFLAALERSEDWRAVVRETEPLFTQPQAVVEAAIERHRSARLGALPRWYEGSARRLVEALVLPLDRERVLAIIRRRSGGATAAEVAASVIGGALLDAAALAGLARAATLSAVVDGLVAPGLLTVDQAHEITAGIEERRGLRWLEDRLTVELDLARESRASGRGADARFVRDVLAAECAEREAVADELADGGSAAAWLLERSSGLARLDSQAHLGARDSLGIGAVAGYVAALEAQAIRLRASLTRIVAAWSPDLLAPYAARTGG